MKMTDPTTIRGSIEVLNQDVVNLDPERFEVKRVTVPLDKCCLVYVQTSAALRSRTLVHKDFDACSILGPYARGRIDGAELRPYAMIAAAPENTPEIFTDGHWARYGAQVKFMDSLADD